LAQQPCCALLACQVFTDENIRVGLLIRKDQKKKKKNSDILMDNIQVVRTF
jgi:hypothetical protein